MKLLYAVLNPFLLNKICLNQIVVRSARFGTDSWHVTFYIHCFSALNSSHVTYISVMLGNYNFVKMKYISRRFHCKF